MSAPDFRDTAKCGQLRLTAVTVGRRRNSTLAAPRTGKRLAGRPRRAPGCGGSTPRRARGLRGAKSPVKRESYPGREIAAAENIGAEPALHRQITLIGGPDGGSAYTTPLGGAAAR